MAEPKVSHLPPSKTYTAEQAIQAAAAEIPNIREVLIIGRDVDGELFAISSRMNCGAVLWLLKEAEDYTIKAGRGEHDADRKG